ncbi:MAG: hypothetical protein KAT71_03815 [Gammaproteobacteria bacterium]|nr:hypothetical protein [Gammaproteobacteria bacterium]
MLRLVHGAVTICEIKYTERPFVIDKGYYDNLLNKAKVYERETHTKKQLFFAIISANGIKKTIYSEEAITDIVVLKDLFKT